MFGGKGEVGRVGGESMVRVYCVREKSILKKKITGSLILAVFEKLPNFRSAHILLCIHY